MATIVGWFPRQGVRRAAFAFRLFVICDLLIETQGFKSVWIKKSIH